MGHRCTSIALIKLLPEGHSVLAQRYEPNLGCLNFDLALFDHLAGKCKQQYGEEILPKTKRGLRLMAACEKFRKVLSTIQETRQHVRLTRTIHEFHFTSCRFPLLCGS